MNITIQTGNLQSLREALKSPTQTIRFGSEFCMYALPTLDGVKQAYKMTEDVGKEFIYVTPRLAENEIGIINEHCELLNDLGDIPIVANDLGTLYTISEYSSLRPVLGRQLVYTPSRCPWNQITEQSVNIFTRRKVSQIFYQTNLNYKPTIDFYKSLGVIGADVDWIPKIFPKLDFIIKNGIPVSVHTHIIPVAITRKCHMARFLGEEKLDSCSRPCYRQAYSMNNEHLGIDLFLHGNSVFRKENLDRKTAQQLFRNGVTTLVVTMNPITGINSVQQIQKLLDEIQF